MKEKLIEFLFIVRFFRKTEWVIENLIDFPEEQKSVHVINLAGETINNHLCDMFQDENHGQLAGNLLEKRGKFYWTLDYGGGKIGVEVNKLFCQEHADTIGLIKVEDTKTTSEQVHRSYLFSLLIEEEIVEIITRSVDEHEHLSKIDDSDLCFYNLVDWMLSFPTSTIDDLKLTIEPILATFLFHQWKLLRMMNDSSTPLNVDCACKFCHQGKKKSSRKKSSRKKLSKKEPLNELWEKFNHLLCQLDSSKESQENKNNRELGKYFQLFNNRDVFQKVAEQFDLILPTVLTNIICEYIGSLVEDETILRNRILELGTF